MSTVRSSASTEEWSSEAGIIGYDRDVKMKKYDEARTEFRKVIEPAHKQIQRRVSKLEKTREKVVQALA